MFKNLLLIVEVYASLIMALIGIELKTLVSEPDALTTRLPPCAQRIFFLASQLRAPKQLDFEYSGLKKCAYCKKSSCFADMTVPYSF